jgi:hypothetical protein
MKSIVSKHRILILVVALALCTASSFASLVGFQQYTGTVGYSAGGWGSTSQAGNISASVPVGSTVVAAYLYSSLFDDATVPGGTLASNPVNYSTALGVNNGYLQAWRADVTSIVKPVIDGGPGGVYSFGITETSYYQDGEALVVVYSNPAIATSTVGIYNGFSASSGDAFKANFATPLDPTAAGFQAEMALGIGYGYNPNGAAGTGQFSNVSVNGTLISQAAGNFDDGEGADGALITVGDYKDPYTPYLPANMEQDHEKYNLSPYIKVGDTSITVNTLNPSGDDNIFLAVFDISGEGTFVNPTVPEPTSILLLGSGLFGLALTVLRKKKA